MAAQRRARVRAVRGISTADVGRRAREGRRHIAQGNARVLYAPAITHPAEHISHEAIGHSLDWFAKTLQGGTPLPAGDQIWFRKELGTLIALVGFIVLLLGSAGGPEVSTTTSLFDVLGYNLLLVALVLVLRVLLIAFRPEH